MNRRGFLGGLAAAFAWLLGGRWLRGPRLRSPEWTFHDASVSWRVLPEPYVIEPGVPHGLLMRVPDPPPWAGRIVRQERLLLGQVECCVCMDPACTIEDGLVHVRGRTPAPGSPERAYLDFMARECPHPEYAHSEVHIVRRLDCGELPLSDVVVRLVSAEEIDGPGSGYVGGRGEAFAEYISVCS